MLFKMSNIWYHAGLEWLSCLPSETTSTLPFPPKCCIFLLQNKPWIAFLCKLKLGLHFCPIYNNSIQSYSASYQLCGLEFVSNSTVQNLTCKNKHIYLYVRVKVLQFGSVQFSHSVVSDSLRPHESQHARPPCSSPSPGVHSDSRPSSPWCHPAVSPSVMSNSLRPHEL